MMGTVVRVKGIKHYRHPKTRKWYCYHRKSGMRVAAALGTAEFFSELAALDRAAQVVEPFPGSLGLVISKYMSSPDWASLRPKTRVSYERAFVVLKPLFEMPLVKMDRAFIFALRDTKILPKHGTWMANYAVTVLTIAFRFAQDRGWLASNPLAQRIKKVRVARDSRTSNRPWTELECRAVVERAPPHLLVPIALAMCAGLRKTDFLTVTMASLKNGAISVRTSKRGVPVTIPVHPILRDAIAARPQTDALQISVNSRGLPWTETGFNASFRTFKKSLEQEGAIATGLTPHGLRHTLGTRLREAGADNRTIAESSVTNQRAWRSTIQKGLRCLNMRDSSSRASTQLGSRTEPE
jgi:integrase